MLSTPEQIEETYQRLLRYDEADGSMHEILIEFETVRAIVQGNQDPFTWLDQLVEAYHQPEEEGV
jgi:hypothetical protein